MGRRATPGLRPAAALGVLLVLPLLAGCNPEADEHASTDTDVSRAEAAWRDPWLAPVELAVPTHAYGSDGYVVRFAGSRDYVVPLAPVDAVREEVLVALADGWSLVGATCGDRKVVAQLSRGDDLDDAVLGAVIATAGRSTSEVTVAGQVPHHADGSWPPLDATPSEVGDSCLSGASAATPLVDLPERPTSGDGEPGLEDFEGWERDEYTEEEQDLLADLAADPWVAANLPDTQSLQPISDLRTGDNNRFGIGTGGELPARGSDPRASVAAVIGEMSAWEPTWAACTPGPRGMVDVRLRRVTEEGVATVRLLDDASSDGVQWTLSTPVAEGPDPSWVTEAPALADATCLSSTQLAPGLTIEGEPVSLPSDLQPVP